MSALKIVHITPTPLVGAPGKIAWAQRMKGHFASAVALSDYPKGGPLEKMFLDRTLLLDDFTREAIEESIEEADIIHIHNFIPHSKVEWIKSLNQSAAYIYHAHSPLREGPLYVGRGSEGSPFDFRLKLVVGQHWGRFYPDFLPVPNLILSPPSIRPRNSGEKLKVMFSPTHKHVGRWTSKYSEKLESVLLALCQLGKIELISPSRPVSPETLMDIRRRCHVSIDEIATGGFHMVSLEGMCAGNIVINRADYFSRATFAGFCGGELPPFVYADDDSIADVLLQFADDCSLTAVKQAESYKYFIRHCEPARLVEIFDAAYKRVI